MYPQFKLFYNGEEIDQLTPEEEKELSQVMTAKGRPASVRWKGDTLETRKLIIRRKTEIENTTINVERVKEMEDIKKEREGLKEETPEKKTFRNYKCIFTWRYLLQYGFSRFFETEDWKNEMPYDTFQRFDTLIWKREPKLMKDFWETLEKYFTDNPNEIWADRKVLARFLPKGDINSKDILLEKVFN